eukprot:5708315-Pyramimonas_sp.AAC.1
MSTGKPRLTHPAHPPARALPRTPLPSLVMRARRSPPQTEHQGYVASGHALTHPCQQADTTNLLRGWQAAGCGDTTALLPLTRERTHPRSNLARAVRWAPLAPLPDLRWV